MKTSTNWQSSAVNVLALLVLTAPATTPAFGQMSRKQVLKAFRELGNQARKAYEGTIVFADTPTVDARRAITKFEGVELAGEKVKQMIEVWAVPVVNGEESDQKVSLDGHKWRPGERFRLYFKSATPINVEVYQVYPDGSRPEVRRFPTDRFRETYNNYIPPRESVRYPPAPLVIKVDDTQDDEVMKIVAVTVGSTAPLPPLPPDLKKLSQNQFLVFAADVDAKLRKKAKEARPLLRFDGEREVKGGNPDNVASFFYGTDHTGTLRLTIQKRRD